MKISRQVIKKNRLEILTFTAILGIAFFFRYWGIDFTGFGDEVKVVAPATNIAKNHDITSIQSYYPYGYINILGTFFLKTTRDCGQCEYDVYLHTARYISILFGTATVALMFFTLRRIFSQKLIVFLGFLLFALFPTHIKFSHYALTEVPLTFFSLLTLFLSLVYLDTKDKRYVLASLASAGIATSIKYPGAVNFGMPVLAYLVTQYQLGKLNLKKIFSIFILTSMVGALMFTVFAFQNTASPRETLNIISELRIRHSQGDLGFTSSSWLFNITGPSIEFDLPLTHASFLHEFGIVIFAAMIAGSLVLLYRRKLHGVLALYFPIAFYIFVNFSSMTKSIKYFLPVTPFVIIATTAAIWLVFQKIKMSSARALVVVLVLATVMRFSQQAYFFNYVQTQDGSVPKARQWADKAIPKGSTVVQFASIPVLEPQSEKYNIIPWENQYRHTYLNSNEISSDRAPSLEQWVEEYDVDYFIINGRHSLKYFDPVVSELNPETTASYRAFFKQLEDETELEQEWFVNLETNSYNWPPIKVYKVEKDAGKQ